jgi:hypothetical protein
MRRRLAGTSAIGRVDQNDELTRTRSEREVPSMAGKHDFLSPAVHAGAPLVDDGEGSDECSVTAVKFESPHRIA